jgi:hypothetical protein
MYSCQKHPGACLRCLSQSRVSTELGCASRKLYARTSTSRAHQLIDNRVTSDLPRALIACIVKSCKVHTWGSWIKATILPYSAWFQLVACCKIIKFTNEKYYQPSSIWNVFGHGSATCIHESGQIKLRTHGVKTWYVSNVSIIFDAPWLFLHHLLSISLHFVAFLCIFRD